MDLLWLFTLCLCWWSVAARSLWSEKPSIIIAEDEIFSGESLEVTCTLPIDYRGGECRLYKEHAQKPFKVMIATDWHCEFNVTADELIGRRQRFGRKRLMCEYQLQQYTSQRSDTRGVTVTRRTPTPELHASHRFVSPVDSVTVHCEKPIPDSSRCSYFRGQYFVAKLPCGTNLTGERLARWAEPAPVLPVNLTCTYKGSRHSNHVLLFVVDASQAASSLDCKVSVDDDQLPAFRNVSWTSVGADGLTVKVQATNSNLRINETCDPVQTQLTDPDP